jgi:HD-GYP domain-containing protein (c-di-GMP phosphodiesterase class II)
VELHHENHNGSGYPHGMSGDQIPLAARIVHVADAYDAMTTDRAYRKALPRERVLAELRKHAGRQFDPAVVEAFICILIGSNPNEMLHDENLERLGLALGAPAHEHTLAGAGV